MAKPVPRKLSSVADHPAFDIEWAFQVEVTLNGEPMKQAVYADVDGGFIDVYDLDDNGRLKTQLFNGKYVASTKRIYGKVEIIPVKKT